MMANTANSDKNPALDSAFPTLALMGVGLFIAIALIVFCGWKIVLLEEERQDLKHERLLLERDRDAFLTYGSELPQLKDEHRVTTEALAMLDEQRKVIEKDIAELTRKRETLNTEARSLSGSVTSLQAQIQAQNGELAQGKTEIDKLRPELSTLRKDLEVLKAQEKSLQDSILQKRKDEAALLAAVAGLERSRAQAEDFLARVRQDREMYADMQKNFGQILATFEGIVSKSGTLTEEYAGKLDDMAKFKTHLDRGMAELDADLHAMGTTLEAIKQDRAAHAALLKQGQEQARSMQGQIDAVAAGNKKFTAAMDSVQGLDKKLQATLAAEVKTLTKLAGEDAHTRANLAAAAQTLGQSADAIKKDQNTAREQGTQLRAILQMHREELGQLHDLAAEVLANGEKNNQTSLAGLKAAANLSETAQSLNVQAEKLQGRLELAQNQGVQMEKLLEAERERLSELLQTARDLRGRLNATEHREEEMKAALTEILALLRHTSEAKGSEEHSNAAEQEKTSQTAAEDDIGPTRPKDRPESKSEKKAEAVKNKGKNRD